MTRVLAREDVQRYDHDGFLFPVPVLSEQEVVEYRCKFDELESRLEARPQPIRQPHLRFRWAYELATHPKVLDVIEDVIGPEIVVHSTIIFYKTPGSTGYVSWHQDSLYQGLRVPSLTSAWIALTDSTAENGCMRVIPGSHRLGILPHLEERNADNLLNRGQTIHGVDESRATDLVMKAGEMSLHDGQLIHGSNSTGSNAKRVGFIIRFATPEMRSPGHPVIHARGHTPSNHLDLLTSPPPDNL